LQFTHFASVSTTTYTYVMASNKEDFLLQKVLAYFTSFGYNHLDNGSK